jgi:hypothetical protein
MTQIKLLDILKKKLRDPIWQAIGALLALVGLFVPFFIGSSTNNSPNPLSSPDSKEVMIYSTTSKSLINFPETLSARTRLFIDGKEEQDVKLYIYFIEYKGVNPLRKGDFEVPIRGSVPQDRKIITVQKSLDPTGPLKLDKESGSIREERAAPIDFDVSLKDQHNFEIKPMLMNPGEWFKVEIYTSARLPDTKAAKSPVTMNTPDKKVSSQNLSSEITWSCRIADIKCPAPFRLELDHIRFNEVPWFLQFQIRHYGWAIYFMVFFTVLNVILLLILAKSARVIQPMSVKEILIFSLGVVSSLAVSEILADWLFNHNNLNKQPFISRMQLLAHVILFIVLLFPIVLRKIKASPINP